MISSVDVHQLNLGKGAYSSTAARLTGRGNRDIGTAQLINVLIKTSIRLIAEQKRQDGAAMFPSAKLEYELRVIFELIFILRDISNESNVLIARTPSAKNHAETAKLF